MQRDVLPKLSASGGALLAIGIGTHERSLEFCDATGFPAEHLYADPDNSTYDALRLRKGVAETFLSWSTPVAIQSRLERDGAADLRALLPRWQPWNPPRMDQALQQGGAFVFRGTECVLSHYDESTGAHVALADLLRAAGLPE